MSQSRQQLASNLRQAIDNANEKKSVKKSATKIVKKFEELEATFVKADKISGYIQSARDIQQNIQNLESITETSTAELAKLADNLSKTYLNFDTFKQCGEQIARFSPSLPQFHLYAGQLSKLLKNVSPILLDKKELRQVGKMAEACSKLLKESEKLHTTDDTLFNQTERMNHVISSAKTTLTSITEKGEAQELHDSISRQRESLDATMELMNACYARFAENEKLVMQKNRNAYSAFLSSHQNHFTFFSQTTAKQGSSPSSPAPRRTPEKA